MHAFSLREDQLNTPGWVESDTFDILANAPRGTSNEQILAMFQSLLAERFNMKFHWETRSNRVMRWLLKKRVPNLANQLPSSRLRRGAL